jgi:hypothetical protein
MRRSRLAGLPSRLQARGEALQIDGDRFLELAVQAATINPSAKLFLSDADPGEQHHRIRCCHQASEPLLVCLAHAGMSQHAGGSAHRRR